MVAGRRWLPALLAPSALRARPEWMKSDVMPPRDRHYLFVRRWVDRKLSHSRRYVQEEAGWPALLPILPLVALRSTNGWAWGVAASISAVWLGFVAWRAIRLIRAGNIKSDRFYDVKGKFDLPPEYAATASILAHQKRGRLGQKR